MLPLPILLSPASASQWFDLFFSSSHFFSITLACYFNVIWKDPRLHLDDLFGFEQAPPGENHTNNPNVMVPMNLEYVKDLWVPNIFIYNLKTYKVIDVLQKMAGVWIATDRTIMFSQALNTKI